MWRVCRVSVRLYVYAMDVIFLLIDTDSFYWCIWYLPHVTGNLKDLSNSCQCVPSLTRISEQNSIGNCAGRHSWMYVCHVWQGILNYAGGNQSKATRNYLWEFSSWWSKLWRSISPGDCWNFLKHSLFFSCISKLDCCSFLGCLTGYLIVMHFDGMTFPC